MVTAEAETTTGSEEKQPIIDADLIKHDNGLWEFDVVVEDQRFTIPVFNIRDDRHKEAIARRIAGYVPFVAHGAGVEGIGSLVEDPRRGRHPNTADIFFANKQKRPRYKKIPLIAPPKYAMPFVDTPRIHPAFRHEHFGSRERFEQLYHDGGSEHLVLPVRRNAYKLDPVLVTSKEDQIAAGRDPAHIVGVPTISLVWWDDPDFTEIFDRVVALEPFGVGGISSWNVSGEKPKTTTEEVPDFLMDPRHRDGIVKYVREHHALPIAMVLRDPIGEGADIKSSHPQFRPAFVGETPEWRVVRRGALDVDDFLHATGTPFAVDQASLAASPLADRYEGGDGDDYVNISDRIFAFREAVDADYRERHPDRIANFMRGILYHGQRSHGGRAV